MSKGYKILKCCFPKDYVEIEVTSFNLANVLMIDDLEGLKQLIEDLTELEESEAYLRQIHSIQRGGVYFYNAYTDTFINDELCELITRNFNVNKWMFLDYYNPQGEAKHV